MSDGYFTNPVAFLVDTLFSLYVLIVMLRFLLQLVRADFYNPISQFVVKASNPLLKPLRRIIPGLGGIDIASLVLAFLVQLAGLVLVLMIHGRIPSIGGLMVLTVAELIVLTINIYIFSILILVIISWINPGAHNPAVGLLYAITEPVMRPVRRMIPPISGIDLSPLVVLIGLQILKMLLVPPLAGL